MYNKIDLMSPRRHVISFYHAFIGLAYALTSQPNFLVHIFISTLVVLTGLYFRLSHTEWLIITSTIFIGLVVEMINTSIESVVDLVSQEWRIEAKHAKDTAAAAMLIYAFGAMIIAVLIFLPKWHFT